MATIERRNFANAAQATGIIAPLLRVATHVGYCSALAGAELVEDENSGPEEKWDESWADIKADLEEALAHLENPPDMSPFVSQEVIELFTEVHRDIGALRSATLTKQEVFEALQALNHNIAYTGARYERSVSGEDVTEGANS